MVSPGWLFEDRREQSSKCVMEWALQPRTSIWAEDMSLGVREQSEDSPRTVAIRLSVSRMQPRESRAVIAFCHTVGAIVTRTLGSSRAVPYSSNQALATE